MKASKDFGKEMRKITINGNQTKHYVNNTIRTAKYNLFSFLPLAVIYQFNNYFNVFFLFTAVILAIKQISPMDPATAISPFVIVILISVIKEGIEDIVKIYLL
jgi:phospholipid-transporting ATPase